MRKETHVFNGNMHVHRSACQWSILARSEVAIIESLS